MRTTCVLAILAVACGGGAATSAEPKAPDGARSGAPSCPSDVATLLGKPCETEGATCGNANDGGFSNIARCTGGNWENVEVPPPPR
jgi:hypothetical protein